MKKILVSILSVLMVLALAAPVSADEAATPEEGLQEAVTMCEDQSDCTITVSGEITINKPIDVPKGANITLNGEEGAVIRTVSGYTLGIFQNLKSENGGTTDGLSDGTTMSINGIEFVSGYEGNGHVAVIGGNQGGVSLIFNDCKFNGFYTIVYVNYQTEDLSNNIISINSSYFENVKHTYGVDDYSVPGALLGKVTATIFDNNTGDVPSPEKSAVASINGEGYKTLEDAIKNVEENETIKLVSYVEVDKMLDISSTTTSGDNFIIDLNGHKITASENYSSSSNNDAHIINVTGKTVTIKGDGTANSAIVGGNNNRHVILADTNANLTLEDLTVDHSQCRVGAPLVVSESDVVLKGTVNFKLNDQSWYAVNVDSDDTNATLEVAEGAVVNSDGSEIQPVVVSEGPYKDGHSTGGSAKVIFNGKVYAKGPALYVQDENGTPIKLSDENKSDYVVLGHNTNVKINTETGVADGEVEPTPTPTPPKPSRPTYRPSSPSKDLPSNTKECQKEFGDEYIWSDEYDACVIKFMIVDTATR